MVDVFGSASAHGAVFRPVAVDREEVNQIGRFGAPLRFLPIDHFAGVFDDFAVRRNRLIRIHTPAMNFRFGDTQFKASVPLVYVRLFRTQTR